MTKNNLLGELDLKESILGFLQSQTGKAILGGLAASTYLDYFETRVLPEEQSFFYKQLKSIIDELLEEEIAEDVFLEKILETKALKTSPDNIGEESFINFISKEDFYAEVIAEEVTNPTEINYKRFVGVDKNFMKMILAEVLIIFNDTIEDLFRNTSLENMIPQDPSKILH